MVKHVKGKDNALAKINETFNSCAVLVFKYVNIYSVNNGTTTFIEFELTLDNTLLKGVDILEWEVDKIKELRAYLDIPK